MQTPAVFPPSEETRSRPKRVVEIELSGRRFRVRSDDDDTYIRNLSEFLNRRLVDMRRASNVVESEHVALLTLIDVADALFREREQREALKEHMRAAAHRLHGVIDEVSRIVADDREVSSSEGPPSPRMPLDTEAPLLPEVFE